MNSSININVFSANNSIGATGPTGPTGPMGLTGFTGDSYTGPTGSGVTGITGNNGSISDALIFYANNQAFTFGNIVGSLNVDGSYGGPHTFTIQPEGIVIPDISGFIIDNAAPKEYIKAETVLFKKINLQSNALKFAGATSESTLGLFGGTTDAFPMGNTGEILFIADITPPPNVFSENPVWTKARGAKGTKWDSNLNEMYLAFTSFREPLYLNNNYASVIGGSGGFQFQPWAGTIQLPTSFIFYNTYNPPNNGVTFGTGSFYTTTEPQFVLDFNDIYILDPKETIEDNIPNKINLSLAFGITGGSLVNKINFAPLTGYTALDTFTPQDVTRSKIGSCCFCSSENSEKTCLDYSTMDYCAEIGGIFSVNSCISRSSTNDCYFEGSCCIYDSATSTSKCVNTTETKCLEYNGFYFPGKVCNAWVNPDEYFSCPTDYCKINEKGRCCIKGRCFNLTVEECYGGIPGALFFAGGTCENETHDSVCCYADNMLGACCKSSECTMTRPEDCIDGGIFMGSGTVCETQSCCGISFQEDYYTGSKAKECKAFGEGQVFNCLQIGDKLAGGYFAGFVGMPNPCSSFMSPQVAFGEPLECRINPRGPVYGNPYWRCKTCIGNKSGSDNPSIKYFARTFPEVLPVDALTTKCLLKTGVPFIQQVYELDNVSWPSTKMFRETAAFDSANGTYAYNIQYSGLAVESMNNGLYKYLASTVYGQDNIHVLWALIVAPEDVVLEGNKNLRWGMIEGRNISGASGPERIYTEEVPTYPVDGYLTTRIYDKTSTENINIWFRPDQYGYDNNAYIRFSVGSGPLWGKNILEDDINSNPNIFKMEYNKLWENNNPLDSAIRQISNINDSQLYGYSDWYIPSIIELNYIYNSVNELNIAMMLDGSKAMTEERYWSSTSVSKLISWDDQDYSNKDSYKLESINSQLEPYLAQKRIKSGDDFNLDPDQAYKFTMAVSNGQKMLTQIFNTSDGVNDGKVESKFRFNKIAALRPVRRIPIIITCSGFNYSASIVDGTYYTSDTDKCASCIDRIEGMCN